MLTTQSPGNAGGVATLFRNWDNRGVRLGAEMRCVEVGHLPGSPEHSILTCDSSTGAWEIPHPTSMGKNESATICIQTRLWHSRQILGSCDGTFSSRRTICTIGTRFRFPYLWMRYSKDPNASCWLGPTETAFIICWTAQPANSCSVCR